VRFLRATYPFVPLVSETQLASLLRIKAIEEALEYFWEPENDKALEELADLLEVIQAACKLQGKTMEDLHSIMDKKRYERGGFESGVVLLKTKTLPLIQKDIVGSNMFSEETEIVQNRRHLTPAEMKELIYKPPYVVDDKIVIPLIPPDRDSKCMTLNIEGKEAILQYDASSVTISFSKLNDKEKANFNQMSLFDLPD